MTETNPGGAPVQSKPDSVQSAHGAHAGPDTYGGTREKLQRFANAQKNAGLDQVANLAQAAHSAAESLEGSSSGMAGLLNEAGDGLDRLSQSFREWDVSEIYSTLHDFARRQPLTFMAGSFAAGLLLARFLKTSREDGVNQRYRRSPGL